VVLVVLHGASSLVVKPEKGEELRWVPDVPLWIRLDKSRRECFDIHVDGLSQTIACDSDIFIDDPGIGEHSLQLFATFLPTASSLVYNETFRLVVKDTMPDWLSEDGKYQYPESVEGYHQWWYHSGVWSNTYWRGVVSHKAPTDMWNYQEIIHEIKPSVVLEVGTRFGGSTLFFSDVMKAVHQTSAYKILTVDIDHDSINSQLNREPRVEILTAPSASLRVQRRLKELRDELPGSLFVILDGDHGADNVTLELQMISQVLRRGDYVVVEDTNLDGHEFAVHPNWGPCPYDAVIQFLAMNREFFRRDLQRERKFGFSQSMAGFLRVVGEDPQNIYSLELHNPYLDM